MNLNHYQNFPLKNKLKSLYFRSWVMKILILMSKILPVNSKTVQLKQIDPIPFVPNLLPGMALGFFNLGPGTRMFGQIGVPSIFWGSQSLGDPLREKEYVLNYEKKRVTNLELILTHMHRTGRQRLWNDFRTGPYFIMHAE